MLRNQVESQQQAAKELATSKQETADAKLQGEQKLNQAMQDHTRDITSIQEKAVQELKLKTDELTTAKEQIAKLQEQLIAKDQKLLDDQAKSAAELLRVKEQADEKYGKLDQKFVKLEKSLESLGTKQQLKEIKDLSDTIKQAQTKIATKEEDG